jgi:ribose transport system substrate-binding protein
MRKILLGTAIVTVAAIAVAGCSSSGGGTSGAANSTSTATSTGAAGNTSTASCVSAVTTAVETAKASPKPNYPTATVDTAKAKGKNVWIIQSTITPLVTDVTKAFQSAGDAAGVKTTVINGNGSVSTTVTGVSQAIAQHASAIVLFAVSVAEVKAQVAQAKAAGIPVIDTFNGDTGQDMSAQGVFGHVSEDSTAAGKTVADWMLAHTECKLDAAILGASVIAPHALSAAGAAAEIKAQCATCKSIFVNLDLTKLVTDAGGQAQQTLRRDPKINVLMSTFDGAVPLIVAGMNQSGIKNVPIISQDGTDASIGFIRSKSSPQIADLALPPVSYIGWAYMDQALRALTGAAPASGVLPSRLIDSTNVGTSGTNLFPSFSDYKTQFEKLWGVTG